MSRSDLAFQVFGLLVFFMSGVLLGAVYDILRIWRALFRSEKRSVFFQDFFYMGLAAFFTFLVNLGVNGGRIRLFLFLGEAFGWFVWHFTAGRVTVGLFRRLAALLYRSLFDPLHVLAVRLFAKIGGWVRGSFRKLWLPLKKHAQNRKKNLKRRRKIVYNKNRGRRKSPRGPKEGLVDHESRRRAKT